MSVLAAPRARRRCAPVVRRIRDESGALVTYMESVAVCEQIGISSTTLNRWAMTNAIRYTDELRGHRHYALVDAAMLRAMPIKESQALGIRRHPERDLLIEKAWFRVEQDITLETATKTRFEWTNAEQEYIVKALDRGDTITSVATKLGRTYSATANRILIMRQDGSLPTLPPAGDEWYEGTRLMLTDAEVSMLDSV